MRAEVCEMEISTTGVRREWMKVGGMQKKRIRECLGGNKSCCIRSKQLRRGLEESERFE